MVTGFVCYCPDLRLYHYKFTDTSKPEGEQVTMYKFDEDELEMAVSTHLAAGNETEAKFMAKITGLGRVNPHKFVEFDVDSEGIVITDPKKFWTKRDQERPEL